MEVYTLTPQEGGYRDGPLAQAQFSYPGQCACDAEGNVYVADQGNHRIRKVGPGLARRVVQS
jgi:hypothetical protein